MSGTQGQGKRLLSLQTALGQDVLQPVAFHADETISTPYAVTVDVVSDNASVDPDAVLYHPACLKVTYGTAEPRILHGLVRSFAATGEPQRGRFSYRLTFVPRLWFMGQTSDCRVFCNKSVTDIISTLCDEAKQTIEVKVGAGQPQKPYVTQYNETDLAFLSRLAEESGFFYYFKHQDGNHTLVLADANSAFPQDPKPQLSVAHEGGGIDVLTGWHRIGATAHGKYSLRDYDPLKPSTPPEGQQPTKLGTAGAPTRDVFAWPALAETSDEASAKARRLIEASEAEAALVEALGENPLLLPGGRFTLSRDPFDDSQNVDYIVRSVSSSGHDRSWLGGDAQADYGNRIVAFKASVPWRDRTITPRPAMGGLYSAVVLGNDGEEIHADQYGRVKVRFFWDHRDDATADSTIWARVIQPWSGNSWGWQHLPRVGTEVAVAFLDGDPDRPVVVGGFYNAEMMPVFPIPGEQNKSGFRSRSTKQGSTSTFSELSFDDTKGSEKVYLHAEKDATVEVENDRTTTVDHDDTTTVKHDQTLTVQNKQTVSVDNGRTTTIKSGDSLTVQNGGLTITASADNISIQANAGKIAVQAMQSIELTVGGNKITIDNQGVTIDAMQIKVQGQAMVQIKGPMAQVNADGMLVLKGGVMMLN
ncbi:type VI secretion system Vgr family protein [Rhodopila sp.]|jgi:type VI secretion system secreted protein VgrG|uniref:type VI secretion system Vgr family protein n=1 Tax=Rhodopila sp. TaxID=2480087 RepID=UPI002B671E7D|nr:type VI secretion system tip protein TssI/VgrG [Rhodopila sp.]HVZ09616.1 type VI secretion system tip protein TssI/VgrG [Rhodopila sp.]